MMGPRPQVLIVHYSRELSEEIAFHMRISGLAPQVADNAVEGNEAFEDRVPDLLVIDLERTEAEGLRLIERASATEPPTRVLVLAQSMASAERMDLMERGATDILTGRVSVRRLITKALATISPKPPLEVTPEGIVVAGALRVDPRRIEVSFDDRPVALSPRQYKLLVVLLEEKGRALSRDEICRRVWGEDLTRSDRRVDVLVRRLRKRLHASDGAFSYVQTVPGTGYRLPAAAESGSFRAKVTPDGVVVAGGLRVDPRRIDVSVDDRPILLTPREYQLLEILLEAEGRAVSRVEISRRLWGEDSVRRDRAVDMLVRQLRRRLHTRESAFSYIQTVPRVGYKLLAVARSGPSLREGP
jgi:DNA-binding response OmpR family regulator